MNRGGKPFKPGLGQKPYIKANGIKHHLRIFLKQRGVIYVCHQAADGENLSINGHAVADLQPHIVSMHTINGNLMFVCRQRSIHDTRKINFAAKRINPDCPFRLRRVTACMLASLTSFPVKILIKRYRSFFKIRILQSIQLLSGFNGLKKLRIRLFPQLKMTVLEPVFLDAVFCRLLHAPVRHIHAGNKANRQYQKQCNNNVFCPFPCQLPQDPAPQHSCQSEIDYLNSC